MIADPTVAPGRTVHYTIRVSPRARRVTLRLSLGEGLVVVVPPGFDQSLVPALVRQKAPWIARVRARLEEERSALAADPASRLPDRVVLPAFGEEWTVEYCPTAGRGAARMCKGGVLRLSGDIADGAAIRAALGRWLTKRARDRLVPWLDELSRGHGLPYKTASVRAQSTRWGSCSRHGHVSLNRSLVFLTPDLARYVLLHELCHTVRMDHSSSFWDELRRHEPACDRLRRELREGRRLVPGWARVGDPG